MARTECVLGGGNRSLERASITHNNWQLISHVVQGALESVSIADMESPMPQSVAIQVLRKE